jgi:ParB-like chromosome segregation protein Spo0J
VNIRKIPLSQIRENDYNPNRMPEALFEALLNSIRDHGYIQPIVVRKVREGYEIVDGAHRFRVLKVLGREAVECVVVSDDETAAKLRTLTMNRLRGRPDNFGVAKILESFGRPEIERYLAYTSEEREELGALLASPPEISLPRAPVRPMPVVVEFLMPRGDAAKVEQALRATGEESRNEGLLTICECYLNRRGEDSRRDTRPAER